MVVLVLLRGSGVWVAGAAVSGCGVGVGVGVFGFGVSQVKRRRSRGDRLYMSSHRHISSPPSIRHGKEKKNSDREKLASFRLFWIKTSSS